jgi:hypothetical protein
MRLSYLRDDFSMLTKGQVASLSMTVFACSYLRVAPGVVEWLEDHLVAGGGPSWGQREQEPHG